MPTLALLLYLLILGALWLFRMAYVGWLGSYLFACALVVPPVLLQDNTWLARNVRLDGEVIIDSGSYVSEGARLHRTVVCRDTFIGAGLDLDGKVYAVLMGTLDHLASKGKMVAPEALELKQELEHAE